jgi:uncharacterized protein (TIGR00369 family)
MIPAGTDLVELFNGRRGGFDVAIGLFFTRVTPDEVACEVAVGAHLTQPYGLVHGGVYASIAETLASAGSALFAFARGQTVVGLENSTSFVSAVRSGKLTAVGVPLHRGRRTQVWSVEVRDDAGKLAAHGRVRMLCLEPGASVAGETVAVKT